MAHPNSDSSMNRRGFLAQGSGALAVAALADSPSACLAAPPEAFEAVKIPEWVFGITRMAFLTPGEVPKAAKAGRRSSIPM